MERAGGAHGSGKKRHHSIVSLDRRGTLAPVTRLLLLLLLVSAACGSSSPTVPPSNTGGGASFDERQACTADADCVAIELECCDQCNGGHAVGVHKDHLEEVRAAYTPSCTDVACTEMWCEPPTAYCASGICGLRFGDREQVDPLPRP